MGQGCIRKSKLPLSNIGKTIAASDVEGLVTGFNVSVPHAIGRAAALSRLRQFLDVTRNNYAHEVSEVRGDWEGNQLQFAFAARGLGVQGTLVVEEDAVHVSGPLQLSVILLRGRFEEAIRQELSKLLR
jgi:hypothetical protein